jgi:hypothetical protein
VAQAVERHAAHPDGVHLVAPLARDDEGRWRHCVSANTS